MVAETTADDVGEWIVVLETPLAEGEQTLSLQAMSPDGTRVLIAPDPVVAAVGKAKEPAASLAEGDKSPEPTREPDAVSESAPSSANETQLADQNDADPEPSETVFSEEAGEGRDTTHAVTLPEPPALAETETQSPAVIAVAPSAPSEQPVAVEPDPPKRPPVVFKTVDYQDEGTETGKISLSGRGDPGARIVLYLDDQPLGQVKIGVDGTWSFATERRLELGAHDFRADHIGEATGLVVGRASVGMKRSKPVPVVAALEPASESQDAVPGAPALAAQASGQESGDQTKPKVYEVRPGDTLWDIAERFFGGGWRYKQIYNQNRKQIRKPGLIYPAQQFDMPDE
jgi:nucleoid-associated protein YgaU